MSLVVSWSTKEEDEEGGYKYYRSFLGDCQQVHWLFRNNNRRTRRRTTSKWILSFSPQSPWLYFIRFYHPLQLVGVSCAAFEWEFMAQSLLFVHFLSVAVGLPRGKRIFIHWNIHVGGSFAVNRLFAVTGVGKVLVQSSLSIRTASRDWFIIPVVNGV